ncbi:MAG: ribonuclease P protein component [Bacteroidales bacterium]|nr:ribonuclease P protein component [Bacteroidales bacterium]
MGLFTFHKREKLNNHSLIRRVFNEGESVYVHPFKIYVLETKLETSFPAQVLISVPKRYFKKAVDRNRLKRLFRESYRMNKDQLYVELCNRSLQLGLGFVYIHKEISDLKKINKSITKAIPLLIKFLDEQKQKQ